MTRIIPAIDIIDGKCVRLTRGDYSSSVVYSGNPVDVAKMFADAGCERLHVVDLDGAKGGHVVNYKVLESISVATPMIVDFGGGIKTEHDIHVAFESGASMVTGGSVAVKDKELFILWLERYGADRIILGADARNGKIAVSGWLENSDCDVLDFISEYVSKGVANVITTDVNVDGTLTGPSLDLYRSIIASVPSVHVIASGGVSALHDIESLAELGIPDVIVGKAIYEGRISLSELEKYNINNH